MDASNNKRSRDDDSLLVFDSSHFFVNLLADDGKPRFPDLQISCGGKDFEVQRSVLASVSPVLNQLFTRHQQNSPGKPLELPKEYVTEESFALILDLIYRGEITIDGDNVLRLHSAGNYLEIDQVTNKCADFILKGLSVDSALSVWDYTCKLTTGANSLLNVTLRFMGEHFSKLVKHDTVMALKQGELCLLQSQLRNVDDENLILEAALEWLGHNWKARFKDCEDVLSRVLWQFVDHTRCVQLKSVRAIESNIDQNSFEEVATMKMLVTKISGIAEKEASPDGSGSNIYYLIEEKQGICGFQKLCLLQQAPKQPVVSKTERQQFQPVQGYLFVGFFSFQGRLIAVSSHKGDNNFKQGFMLAAVSENGDSKMLAHLEVLEMSHLYEKMKITSHNGILSIFFYNPCCKPFLLFTYDLCKFGRRFLHDDDELVIIPVLSRTINAQAADGISHRPTLPFTNEVYFFGVSKAGNNSYTDSVDVDVFHVANQKWSNFPFLQTARRFATAEVIDRSFFVVGGRTGSSSVSNAVERISIDDPSAWEQLPGLKYDRYYCRLISCGHFLIAFGGYDGSNAVVVKAEILDLQNPAKGWEEYPPLHGVRQLFVVKV